MKIIVETKYTIKWHIAKDVEVEEKVIQDAKTSEEVGVEEEEVNGVHIRSLEEESVYKDPFSSW